jgi:hypothetical protein
MEGWGRGLVAFPWSKICDPPPMAEGLRSVDVRPKPTRPWEGAVAQLR